MSYSKSYTETPKEISKGGEGCIAVLQCVEVCIILLAKRNRTLHYSLSQIKRENLNCIEHGAETFQSIEENFEEITFK